MAINSGRSRLAAYVALAYTLIIVYASLQPFDGWRMPPAALFNFLLAPWPRYITTGDIVLNVAAYLPFGAMLVIALRPRCAGAAGIVFAVALAASLSFMLESVQMFLPARIASNIDLLANSGGAALGAAGAWIFSIPAITQHPIVMLRRRIIRTDVAGDCGLIVLAVWLFIQFDPAPLALASGDLREALGFNALFPYAPATYQNVEMGVAMMTAVALGLLAAQIAATQTSAVPLAACALTLTCLAKSIAVWSFARAASPLQWLTPGVTGGALVGIAILALLIWLPSAWRSTLAISCLLAGVTLVNITPENPYQNTPAYLLASQQSHLSSFSNIVRVLSQLWPFSTIALLCILARGGRPPSPVEGAA